MSDAPHSEFLSESSTTYTVIESMFDGDFWQRLRARMCADDAPALTEQLLIVPDGSLLYPWRAVWKQAAIHEGCAQIVPSALTTMAWVKSHGAPDWDARHTERTLDWMHALPHAPQLQAALGAVSSVTNNSAGVVPQLDVLSLAAQMVALSDELSIHLLAGRDIAQLEKTIQKAVAQVYRHHAGVYALAQEEWSLLLQCWQADVNRQTPIIAYLAQMQAMVAQTKRRFSCIWVVRNRPWTAHEQHFWTEYAHHTQVKVVNVAAVKVHSGLTSHLPALQALAGAAHQGRYLIFPAHSPMVTSSMNSSPTSSQHPSHSTQGMPRLYACSDVEQEAQAIAHQVVAWQNAGKMKLALVALDRQVSRRVWALLSRVGISIRDDTGWLLSTARAASAWDGGLQLIARSRQSGFSGNELYDWFSHPMVWGNASHTTQLAWLQAALRRITRYQSHPNRLIAYGQSTGKNPILRGAFHADFKAWAQALALVSAELKPDEAQTDTASAIAATVQHILMTQDDWANAWTQARPLAEWGRSWQAWAQELGLLAALALDTAGAKWCDLIQRYQGISNPMPLTLTEALRFMQSEVETLTYSPTAELDRSQDGASDTVVLMPLGNTRLRQFDAVWLLGASANNLPAGAPATGLLNESLRRTLGLPTHQETQTQMRLALLDLIATHPECCASYSLVAQGVPQSLSPWLEQWAKHTNSSTSAPTLPPQQAVYQAQSQRANRWSEVQDLPRHISASDIHQLAECPYRFWVKKGLNLYPNDPTSEQPSASLKGQMWHTLIETYIQISADTTAQSESDFRDLLKRMLLPLCAVNPYYWDVYAEFEQYIPAWWAWWCQETQAGWQNYASEGVFEIPNETVLHRADDAAASWRPIWHGRIDHLRQRINVEGNWEWSVIDYKTNNLAKHRKSIQTGHDTQLAFYAQLVSPLIKAQQGLLTSAQYVGVTRKADEKLPTAELGSSQEITQAKDWLKTTLNQQLQAIANGEPLRALGNDTACRHCADRVLCRRDYVV